MARLKATETVSFGNYEIVSTQNFTFFRSVGCSLRGIENEIDHLHLRWLAMKELLRIKDSKESKHMNLLLYWNLQYGQKEDQRFNNIEDYIKCMSKPAQHSNDRRRWGQDDDAYLLSHILNRIIIIVNQSSVGEPLAKVYMPGYQQELIVRVDAPLIFFHIFSLVLST